MRQFSFSTRLGTPPGRTVLPPQWKGIEKGDGAYVLSRRPHYIQFSSAHGSDQPVFLSDIEIFASPRFWREYQRVEFEVPGAGHLILFEQRPEPAAAGPSPEQWRAIHATVATRLRDSAFRY